MADNTTLNTGSGGDVIGSDDISGVKYQRVKVILGADGTNDGDVDASNPMPVGGESGSGIVPIAVGSTGAVKLQGYTAEGSAITLSPVTVGARGKSAPPNSVDDGDVVNAWLDLKGSTIVRRAGARELLARNEVDLSSSTSETTWLAQEASTAHELVQAIFTNTSATDVTISIRDSTGGAVVCRILVKGGSTENIIFDPPLFQSVVNTNWTVQSSGSVTSLYAFGVWSDWN